MTMSRFRPCTSALRAMPLLAIAAAFVLANAGGCAYKPIEPWVKPYERERLADPVMKTSLNELPGRQQDHIYTVREGSRGATGVQGGGCGCN
jgi:hypothetical protein